MYNYKLNYKQRLQINCRRVINIGAAEVPDTHPEGDGRGGGGEVGEEDVHR